MTTINIGTAQELVAFAQRVNAGETTLDAELTANIDLTGVSWTPIGDSSHQYGGVFDGNGHTISNLNTYLIDYIVGGGVTKLHFVANTGSIAKNTQGGSGGIIFSQIWFESNNTMLNNYGKVKSNNCTIHDCIWDGDIGSSTTSSVAYPFCYIGGSLNQIYNVYSIGSVQSKFAGQGVVSVYASSPTTNTNTVRDCAVLLYTLHYGTWGSGIGIRTDYATLSNNYINSAIAKSGGTAQNENGQSVASSVYSQQGFWDGTGVSGTTYLSWDFENIWYWDSTDNLPKLQVFRTPTISSLTLTSPATTPAGRQITGTVTASGSSLVYQWYKSMTQSNWSAISGQTAANLDYTSTDVGTNYFKVTVTSGSATVDSISAGFNPLSVNVLKVFCWTNVNGVWKEVTSIYVNVNGNWIEADSLHVNVNGNWTEV